METKEMRFWGDRSFVFFSLQEEHSPDSRSNSFISLLMPLPSWFLCIFPCHVFSWRTTRRRRSEFPDSFLTQPLDFLVVFFCSPDFSPPSSSSPSKNDYFLTIDVYCILLFTRTASSGWFHWFIPRLFVLLLHLPAVVFSHLYISCRLLMSTDILLYSLFLDIISSRSLIATITDCIFIFFFLWFLWLHSVFLESRQMHWM